MSDFREITIWENKRRLERLQRFRSHVVQYFQNVEHNWRVDDVIENERAQAFRPEINKQMRAVKEAIGGARLASFAFDPRTQPPMRFDFFSDLFRLRQFNATEQWPIDLIDRAIGIYEGDQADAKFRTFNPFWWLGKLLVWFARIPFMLAGAAGFDTSKIEQSVAGKIIRLIVWLGGAVATYLTLREYLFVPQV